MSKDKTNFIHTIALVVNRIVLVIMVIFFVVYFTTGHSILNFNQDSKSYNISSGEVFSKKMEQEFQKISHLTRPNKNKDSSISNISNTPESKTESKVPNTEDIEELKEIDLKLQSLQKQIEAVESEQ